MKEKIEEKENGRIDLNAAKQAMEADTKNRMQAFIKDYKKLVAETGIDFRPISYLEEGLVKARNELIDIGLPEELNNAN